MSLSLNVHSYFISSKEWVTVDLLVFLRLSAKFLPKGFKKTKVPQLKTEDLSGINPCSKYWVEWVGENV